MQQSYDLGPSGSATSAGSAPVLLTTDEMLEAEVRRLAAAAGSALTVTAVDGELLAHWGHASVILVGSDALAAVARLRPDRRDGVHVITSAVAQHDMSRDALAIAAESVVELPDGAQGLGQLLADAGERPTPTARSVCVIGGAGGVGASVFAAALALEASTRAPTVLIDADPCGAGVEHIVGIDGDNGVSWGGLTASGRLSARALRDALPRAGQLSVLGFAADLVGAEQQPVPAVAREVGAAARRGFGLVVIDLPRHPGEAAAEFLARSDALVVVTTLSLNALTATARLRSRLPTKRGVLVARGRERGVDAETAARAIGLPLAVTMAEQRGLDESIALGIGPMRSPRGPLARSARRVIELLDANAAG